MGYLLVNVQLPDSASLERTRRRMDQIEKIARTVPGIRFTQAMTGQSLLLSANGSNFGSMFFILDEYEERPDPVVGAVLHVVAVDQTGAEGARRWLEKPPAAPTATVECAVRRQAPPGEAAPLSSDAIAQMLRKQFEDQIPEAMIPCSGRPPVRGVGRAGGFKVMIEDRGDNGPATLQGADRGAHRDAQAAKTRGARRSSGMTSVFRANVRRSTSTSTASECMTKEVPLQDLFDTLRIYLGSLYVNDFNLFGRTWQVIVQAEPRFRNKIDDVRRLKVRNTDGGDGARWARWRRSSEINGPLVLTRYNMYPAAPINGAAAPGVSSGEAIKLVEQLADDPRYGLPTRWPTSGPNWPTWSSRPATRR